MSYKKLFQEANIKKLVFSVVEPGDPDVGDPGFWNEVTILFKKDTQMDSKGLKEFSDKLENLLGDYLLDSEFGSIERIK